MSLHITSYHKFYQSCDLEHTVPNSHVRMHKAHALLCSHVLMTNFTFISQTKTNKARIHYWYMHVQIIRGKREYYTYISMSSSNLITILLLLLSQSTITMVEVEQWDWLLFVCLVIKKLLRLVSCVCKEVQEI